MVAAASSRLGGRAATWPQTSAAGARQIGGMCIEVAGSDRTRILIRLGMPLIAPDDGESEPGTVLQSGPDLVLPSGQP